MNSNHSIILASNSPRRHSLMDAMGYRCTIVQPNVKEDYPPDLPVSRVPAYLAKKKAFSVQKRMLDSNMIMAADTIVVLKGKILNKPADRERAVSMLTALSEQSHTVITGVCMLDKRGATCFSDRATVTFQRLDKTEIMYYVDHAKPYDKAGGYGIQDWMGMIGIRSIQGSYTTVMGLPTHKVHAYMKKYHPIATIPDTHP